MDIKLIGMRLSLLECGSKSVVWTIDCIVEIVEISGTYTHDARDLAFIGDASRQSWQTRPTSSQLDIKTTEATLHQIAVVMLKPYVRPECQG